MSADHDEFAAVLLARKVITSEQLVEAWKLAGRRQVPVEDALVMLGHATTDEVNAARAILAPSSRWLDYADLLVWRRIITAEQLEEARSASRQTGARLIDAMVKLGHASEEQVMRAMAEFNGLPFIDLTEVTIPPAIIELMPESVARENVVLPLAVDGPVLKVITSEPSDVSTLEKLQFILNREIAFVVAVRNQIVEAINRHYGESETESVDSMLAEFTDTAIDFTETEATRGGSIDLKLTTCETRDADVPLEETSPAGAARPVERRATVRYYHRMNPQRTFPLLVILSPHQIEAVVQRGVRQAQSQAFRVEQGSLVEIEPVLPGCACFPPREQVRVGAGEVSVTFWVVPQVLGRVMQARVVVRQEGDTLAEVPLEMAVVEQSLTRLVGALSLVLPFVLFILKQYGLDYDSQKEQDFSLYAEIARWLLARLTPEVLTGLLLAATVGLYFWLRPRRRDVFWDVKTREPAAVPTPAPEEPRREAAAAPKPKPEDLLERAKAAFARGEEREGERLLGELLAARPLDTAGLLLLAEQREKAGKHATAVVLYERALATGRCEARAYFRASLAAHLSGDTARALGILEEAETDLPPEQMRGPMWYNRGCFAARLGRFPEALRCLNRAVDAGFDDLDKFRADPDLEPLRWHAGFRRLLAEVAR
jgi:tetratricopeptide (TPR) repeat protein